MDKGAAVEYDTPENLFRQGGVFYSMCDKSNISIEDIEVRAINQTINSRIWAYVCELSPP